MVSKILEKDAAKVLIIQEVLKHKEKDIEYLSCYDIQTSLGIKLSKNEISFLIEKFLIPLGMVSSHFDSQGRFLGYSS